MNNTNKVEKVSSSTLAHEMVAREEQNVGIFLSAFAIQYYFSKEMLKYKLNKPKLLMYFGDIELYASQRVLIKNIISNPFYHHIIDKISVLLLEHNQNSEKLPHEMLLSKMNKAFIIRQIFQQTDQILPRYEFIDKFINISIVELDLNRLFEAMKDMPIEQQILILTRIFSNMKDDFEEKKKSLNDSFNENIKRVKQDYINKNKTTTIEYENIEFLWKSLNN